MANGEWRMANGEWRMANGEWRMAKPGHSQGVKLLPHHHAHDARHLIQRWRVLARETGCKVRTLCTVEGLPVIVLDCGPWQCWIRGRAMRFGLFLQEDYDAQGIYLYELNHAWQTVGHDIIENCSRVIAADPRTGIDGQRARPPLTPSPAATWVGGQPTLAWMPGWQVSLI